MEVRRGTGTLLKWFGSFGFIKTAKDEHGIFRDLFVHFSAIQSGFPTIGSRAFFTIGTTKKGLVAVNVTLEPKVVVSNSTAEAILAGKTLDETRGVN
jgi:cold shock CspA family protein